MKASLLSMITKFVSVRRYDGKWLCLSPTKHIDFIFDPDHKRWDRNNFYPVFEKFVKSGTVVIDVGTSFGEEVIDLSKMVGAEGLVYAIEPDPISFEALKRTVEMNKMDNVICINKFAGNQKSNDSQSSHAQILSLDELWEDIKPREVSFVKIDTDGSDLEVLKGAEKLIEETPSLKIICEFLPKIDYSGYRSVELLNLYSDMGFDIFKIQTSYAKISGPEDFQYLVDYMNDPDKMICHDLVLMKHF